MPARGQRVVKKYSGYFRKDLKNARRYIDYALKRDEKAFEKTGIPYFVNMTERTPLVEAAVVLDDLIAETIKI